MSAAENPAVAGNNSIVLSAFDRWTASRNFIANSGEDEGQDKPHWDVIDEAIKIASATSVTSAKAAEAPLWMALEFLDDFIDAEARLQDLPALLVNDGLGWQAKLIVRSIANLRAMAED